jgi:hypothetical protein
MQCFSNFLESIDDISLIASAASAAQKSKENESRLLGNALARSGYVLLCGYFEGFIRDLISEFADGINDAKVKIGRLPDHIQFRALQDVVERMQPEDAATRIRTSILADSHLPINGKKLSKTGGNPTVDTVEALFSVLGFPDVIDALSIKDFGVHTTFVQESQVHPQMKAEIDSTVSAAGAADSAVVTDAIVKLLDARWAPKKKRRKVAYVSEIERLLERRNRIAHGEGREPIAVQDLSDASTAIVQLSRGLHDLLNAQLASLGVKK